MRIIKGVAFRLGMVFTSAVLTFNGLYAIQEDPGGWRGSALLAVWVVPILLLAVVGWLWPRRAVALFGVLAVGVVLISGWATANPDEWADLEERIGALRGLVAFAVGAPTVALGWRRPAPAGGSWWRWVRSRCPGDRDGPAVRADFSHRRRAHLFGLLFLVAARLERRRDTELSSGEEVPAEGPSVVM